MLFTQGCGICGEELVYDEAQAEKECTYCHSLVESNVACPNGHFVCDDCHRSSAIEVIEKHCNASELDDPLEMAVLLMKHPALHMHGPEHHYLVPAVLLAAYYNHRNEPHIKMQKLAIARKRAETVPGGYCGSHGTCGAAVGAGIFISIITGSTPLCEEEWKLSNKITGESLLEIASKGGPRCCKRDSFIVIRKAVDFLSTHLQTELPCKEVTCHFHHRNKQCLHFACDYYPS